MKKTLKKSLALLLVAMMLFGASPIIGVDFSALVSAADENDLAFKLINNDTEFEISACGWSASGNLTIPATYGGLPVTSIGDLAFYYCESLESVTIPDSVTNIGTRAFQYCKSFESINIPASVTSIGEYAFYYCDKIVSVTFAEGSKLESIGSSAFAGCSKMESIVIPEGVTSIGDSAFFECNSLVSITFAEGSKLERISASMFTNCQKMKSIIIPEGVTSIDDNAFFCCFSLESVTFAEESKLKSIDSEAFYYCSEIKNITIPEGVTSIGARAFYNCQSLSEINVVQSNANYYSVDGVLFSKDGKTLVCYPAGKPGTSYEISASVTCIDDCAFEFCNNLESVTFADGIKLERIGKSAFEDCASLERITIPASVTSIGGEAFVGTAYYNDNDNWIDGALYIGDCFIEADSECISCNIVQNTRLIADAAFGNAYGLIEINAPESNANYSSEDGVLFSKAKDVLVCYPCLKTGTSYIIPNSVTRLASSAFYCCGNLESIYIPASVMSIGDGAFEYCDSILSVTFAEGGKLKSIGEWTFYGCTSLESIDIPDGVTSIEKNAFKDCESLESVTIPEGVTSIGNDAFEDCENLDSISIPESVTYIGEDAFEDCDNIADIYYGGNESDWEEVYLGPDNGEVFNAVWHFSIVVTDVTLDITSHTLAVGAEQKLTNTVAPDDATNKNVTWASSDTTIASVDKNGLVTAIAAGTATITVTTRNKSKTATCEITVVVPVTGVTLNITSKTLIVGATQQLTKTVAPENATNQNVTWESSDPAVASVDENGLVTAIAAGTATITVTTADGSKTATCEITVVVPVTGVTLDITSKTLIVGATQQLVKTVAPENATNKNVTWESSDPAVATVNANGLVTAIAAGTATITVTTADGSKTATCEITVNCPTVSIENLNNSASINYGETLTLTAVTTDIPEGAKVEWSVQGTGVRFKASADGTTCEVTSTESGTVTVTAKIVDADGEPITDADGNEISSSQQVESKVGFLQKLIAVFKTLFKLMIMLIRIINR